MEKEFSLVSISKDQVLFEQEITKVDKFYILSKGLAKYYYEQNNRQILTGELKPGDNFGGISILLNDAVSIRSLIAIEDCVFTTITANAFLELCKANQEFQDYFTSEFGRCMLNKSFAGIISRQIKDKEFSLPFFNRPIHTIFKPSISTCTMDTTIEDAAFKMSQNNASAIFIKKEKLGIQGIVTDADLRKKVLGQNMNLKMPVSSIMSSPLVSISADCQVFEAFLTMNQEDKRHLVVHGQSGNITGIISEDDLISAQVESTYLLIKTVKSAKSISDIENIHSKLEKMLLDPIKNGANTEYITRVITTFSDAIIDKIISFSLEKMGTAPCKFVFLTMGSEGRGEQTLVSDQDNAIIFEDTKDNETSKKYFDDLSILICDQLALAGYKYCDGDNMASNPKWCQPLSQWKKYFKAWIETPAPENLLNSSIFFDFRGTWGDIALSDELKDYLFNAVENGSFFLRNLTENALTIKPPLSMFGKLITKTQGDGKGSLDIKKAMLPIIDFARIYSLKNAIGQSNTLVRLFRLYTRHAITNKEYIDIIRAYNYMMQLRFLRQITTIIDEEKPADNNIYLDNLSALDHIFLKEIIKITEKLQQKLKGEFARTS
ncbi:MAG: CBS domain-containing protein [Desulfobacula sp.]|nr:CBS domain-containing protein [Desulfobacula sp.]